ncbi:L,D-transpeptidase [Phenylobacterium sp.]|uniref:L,D-transpeptidase n=1 Tax=Phenylobacterium sp. TaxID=1871053 RepID=UPI00391A52E0
MRSLTRSVLFTLAMALALPQAVDAAPRKRPAPARAAAVVPPSPTVAALARWAVGSGDAQGLPFVIVDKEAARVFAYDARGAPMGQAPALLGVARGDHSAPGVGDRELSDIPPEDRTTPAGRFVASYGPAAGGGQVLWVDYGAAISLHPLAPMSPKERRPQRLASATPLDNRITFGCINVPKAFYDKVVRPAFKGSPGDGKGVVYVLPDTLDLAEVFPAFAAQASQELPGDEARIAAAH